MNGPRKPETELPSILRKTICVLALMSLVAKGGDAHPQAPSRIHIGNYLVTTPTGIAFVADDAAAFVLDFGGVNERRVCAAPDDSFHQLDGDVTIERGRTGDVVVARLTSSKPTNVKLQLSRIWLGFDSRFTPVNSGVTGETELKDGGNYVAPGDTSKTGEYHHRRSVRCRGPGCAGAFCCGVWQAAGF